MTSFPDGQGSAPSLITRRVGELQHSEGFRDRSPSSPQTYSSSDAAAAVLPTVEEQLEPAPSSSSTAPSSTSPRRQRAGTLPSTFHLSPSESHIPSSRHNSGSLLGLPGTTISLPASGATTPISEFAFSSALIPTPIAVPSASSTSGTAATSRLRSGSLTLPASGLATAFGPNVFSSTGWTPQEQDRLASSSNQATPSGKHDRMSAVADEVRSPGSTSFAEDSQRTLDFLGLDGDTGGFGDMIQNGAESARAQGLRSASLSVGTADAQPMQRLGSAGSLASPQLQNLAFSNQPSRIRSNTVAAFTRTPSGNQYNGGALPSSSSSFLANPISSHIPPMTTVDDFSSSTETSSSYHRSNDSSDSSRLLYATSGQDDTSSSSLLIAPTSTSTLSPSRTRAATIGILDDSKEVFMRRRAGTTTGLTPHAMQMAVGSVTGAGATGLTRGLRGLSLSQEDGTTWTNASSSSPITPDGTTTLNPPYQQPTRSLWIGNLDPKTSPAELQNVFAPYGAIESLRLIPEKECGFVNFVSVQDAIRAKEDVLSRLGGRLTKNSGMVRIGYGKDAVLAAPAASLAQMRTSAGPVLGNSAAPPTAAEIGLQTAPTRALWVGSIPSSTTPNHLLSIFAPFGPIESARVLTHKSCGFINFERLDDAINARKALNGREILGAEVGSVRIGFAKVPSKIVKNPFEEAANGSGAPYMGLSMPPDRQIVDGGSLQDFHSNLMVDVATNPRYSNPSPAMQLNGKGVGITHEDETQETATTTVDEWQLLMRELSGSEPGVEADVQSAAEPRPPATYYTSIPLGVLSDSRLSRRYTSADGPRLREIRKSLDGPMTAEEVDALAYKLVEECVALSSDYIGNTIIQKLFEKATLPARLALLERLAPHMAAIGTHKNGTWAVQRAIQCVQEPEEMALIQQNLAPYTPPLLLNDFGNYVVQGALRFGSPMHDFIFDAMVDRCWEIGSGRFGARSTRQTLESSLASPLNVKRVAIAIILNSIPLATSANGALLITWLLDSSNLPGRYRLLAPRFAPHLAHLCTHKLASASVLKLINQRVDPVAARAVLDVIFSESDTKVLEEILSDQIHGTACITKMINSTFVDEPARDRMAQQVRAVLLSLRVSAVPAYRKLVEELGLPYSGATNPSPPLSQGYNGSYGQQQQRSWPPAQAAFPPPFAGPFGYQPYTGPYGGAPIPMSFAPGPMYTSQPPPHIPQMAAYRPAHQQMYPYNQPYLASPPADLHNMAPVSPPPMTVPHNGFSPTLSAGTPAFGEFAPFSPLGSPRGSFYPSLNGSETHFPTLNGSPVR